MNRAQIAVLAVAVIAGAGAFVMMNGSDNAPQIPIAQAPAPVENDEVLVATHDLSYGAELNDPDTNWAPWPKNIVPQGVIRKSEAPNAKEDLKSSYVRVPISNGEPVRRERLVKGVTAGLMSTMIASGKRAIAIDVSLNTTAGGFILPNDHVDVLRTFRDQELTRETGQEVVSSEVVLTNVRVLAMGQTIEKKNDQPVVTGATATLELDPRQTEMIILAQRTGQLALALRPIVDAFAKDDAQTMTSDEPDGAMTIVRRGVSVNQRSK
jgi:pilus assembly protein CpaB